MNTILYFVSFVLILIIIISIRTKTKNKYEIKMNDVVIALIPIILFLFINGDISKLKIGDLEIEKAFKEAYESSINDDLTKVEGDANESITTEIERVLTDNKGDIDYLRSIEGKNIKALNLKLNYEFYTSWAIQEYIRFLPALYNTPQN